MLLKSLKTLLGFGLLGFVSVWIGCSDSSPVAPSAGKSLTDDSTPPADSRFPDENLAEAVRIALGAPAVGVPISAAEIASLTVLKAHDKNIRSLAGLEHATGLDTLSLEGNTISDLSPLAKLTNLKHLHLRNNTISNVDSLAKLTNLKYLSLHTNQLTSSQISPLTRLTNLEVLHLDGQGNDAHGNPRLTDVNSLARLTNLKRLRLRVNKGIMNVASFGSLTNLEYLDLSNTKVSDLSPLTCLTNLETLKLFRLVGRYLSNDSVNIYIPFFRAQGVVVRLALSHQQREMDYLNEVGLSP